MTLLDLILGPTTDLAAKFRVWLRADEGDPQSEWARWTLKIAVGQLGLGEVGGNNRGPHVRRWSRGRDNVLHCAAFTSWCAEEAALALGYRVPLFEHRQWPKWRLSAKASWRELGKLGQHVELPLPGDFSLFERGRDDDWRGHIEIVESVVAGTDRFVDIGANVGPFPAVVKKINRERGRQRHIGWVRLPDIREVGERITNVGG